MERQLFTWKQWNAQDVGSFGFIDVELIKQVGQFPPGTKFGGAYIDYGEGFLQLQNYGDKDASGFSPVVETFDFKLGLVVL